MRTLAFISVALLELLVRIFVVPFAGFTGLGILLLLDPLHERLRPPAPLDPATDLRVVYLEETK